MPSAARLILTLAVVATAWHYREVVWPWIDARLVDSRLPRDHPRERYVTLLARSGLLDTHAGREWLASGERAIASPTPMRLPFVHNSNRVAATAEAYEVLLARGRLLDVRASLTGEMPAEVFVEIFEPRASSRVQLTGAIRAVQFEAERDSTFIIRTQPEMLRAGRLRVTARDAPSLLFPVAGATARDLKSVFGADRDEGRRLHEGVDIFAKRGTDVLSASAGVVTRVNTTSIGGRVVWVWDPSRSLMLYYAHLDEQLVTTGMRVRAGEVLGRVGNTGNARTTPPHLHFGIYERGTGAIDPDAFIRPAN